MHNLITKIQQTTGKKRYFLSFFFGCLVSAALAPVYFIPAAIIGFTAFLWQIDICKNRKQAFWLGWWFGWGHFTAGLYWISFALLTDVQQFGWMIPFAIFGIPAVLAFYTAIVSLITYLLPQKNYQRVVLFAILWTVIEMLRSVLFTGFPWNLTGYVWTFSDSMLQITSITGIWGLSFITVLAFAMPYSIKWGKKTENIVPTIIAFSCLILIFTGGYIRLQSASNLQSADKVRIIQGNIKQDLKWDEDKRSDIVHKYMMMTSSNGINNIKLVVWPESALPYFLEEGSELVKAIKTVIPINGMLITGSMHAERSSYGFVNQIWNSMHTIDSNGTFLAVYDKHHLVPFGEYVPFRNILPIDKITSGQTDFSEGDGVKTLPVPGIPSFSPLICYEAIFPGAVIDKNDPPQVMINVTNDAWYGNTSGPYQHFNMVRVRAVEHGLPLIRAANTGLSGIIDSYGRVVARTKLGEDAVLDEYIPEALPDKTIFTRFGNLVILLIMGLAGGLVYFRK